MISENGNISYSGEEIVGGSSVFVIFSPSKVDTTKQLVSVYSGNETFGEGLIEFIQHLQH